MEATAASTARVEISFDPAGGSSTTSPWATARSSRVVSHAGAFVLAFEGDRWPTTLEAVSSSCELQGDNTMSGMDDVC